MRRSRTKILLLGLLTLGVVLAIVCVRLSTDPPAALEREGDRSAAAFADQALLAHLQALELQTGSPEDAISSFLLKPDGEFEDPYPFAIKLISETSSTFDVAIYRHVEKVLSIVPFTGDEYWGRACRRYEVQTGGVAVISIDCPADLPASPLGVTDK